MRRWKRRSFLVIVAAVTFAVPVVVNPAMAEPGSSDPTVSIASNPVRFSSVTFNAGESELRASLSDGIHAYYATDTSPGKVIKVRLSDMTRVGALTLGAGENFVTSAVSDGTYGYFATNTTPASVVKVRLSDMTRVAAQVMLGADGPIGSAVTDGTHAYFGTDTNPGKVIKVRLTDLARVEGITLNAGEGDLSTGIIYGGAAYFSARQTGGASRIVKVQLSPLARLGSLTLADGEVGVESAVLSGIYGYYGTFTAPGRVVKVRLTDLTRVGARTFNVGEDGAAAAISDGTHVYFGASGIAGGRIVKVRESDLVRVGSVALAAGESVPLTAVRTAGYGFFGTLTIPGRVVAVATVISGPKSCGFIDEAAIAIWARDGACWLKEAQITATNPFRPGDAVNRAEMVTFLWRFAGQPAAKSSCGFIDGVTAIPNYARFAACWARATRATSADPFRATDLVNRAELAAFLWRVSGSPPAAESCGIEDEDLIPFWARQGVCFLTGLGVTYSNPYRPGGSVSRAEMAAALLRLNNIIPRSLEVQ